MELADNNRWVFPDLHLREIPLTLQRNGTGSQAESNTGQSALGFRPDLNEWKRLMTESQHGSKRAYRMLLTEIGRWLDSFIFLEGVEAGADHLINEVLRTVHRKRHTYCHGQCVAAWVSGILQHRLAYPLKPQSIPST